MAEEGPLAAALLRSAPAREPETVAGGGWAYGRLGIALVSLFLAYHTLALLLHVTPSGGLARQAEDGFGRALGVRAYIHATSNVQSWSMFAPNPFRENIFVRVLVEGADGEVTDLGHDIHGRRRYPYVVYDRLAKINRRLADQQWYLEPYAAWVCREWERTHGGEPARRVHLVKLTSHIPPPREAWAMPPAQRPAWSAVGFDPRRLPVEREVLRALDCDLLRDGQLSPERRAALGLPPAPGRHRPTELPTWWDQRADAAAERAADPGADAAERAEGGGG
ncbi:MAG: hypothetical protein R3A79_19640 [Nannocystaceae bacterium]